MVEVTFATWWKNWFQAVFESLVPVNKWRKSKTHNFDASNLMLQGVRPTLPAWLKIKIWRNTVRGSPTGPLHQATTRPGRKTIHK